MLTAYGWSQHAQAHFILGYKHIYAHAHTLTKHFTIQDRFDKHDFGVFGAKFSIKYLTLNFCYGKVSGFCLWLFTIKLDRCEWGSCIHHSIEQQNAHAHTHLIDVGKETEPRYYDVIRWRWIVVVPTIFTWTK